MEVTDKTRRGRTPQGLVVVTNLRIFLLVIVALSPSLLTSAALTFQRSTDMLGVATTFQEDSGLPTRNFTISSTVRSASGRSSFIFPRGPSEEIFFMVYRATGKLDIILDSNSYHFDPWAKFSAEDAIMSMRTWSVTYDDSAGELSLFIDAVHIETLEVPPLFPDKIIFGSDAIEFFVTGVESYVTTDDLGDMALVPISAIDGFFGQLDSFQLWDRALNASEIGKVASPNNLTGDEQGLCLYWTADRGHGSRISNLGSAGAKYDAVLGRYAIGKQGQTSAVYGSGCESVSTTPPTWVNSTLNSPPSAESITLEVRKKGRQERVASWVPDCASHACCRNNHPPSSGNRIDQ